MINTVPAASMTEETQLVQLCIAQNRLAQKRLYEQYKKAMYSKAFRILNDYDDANDALQEAFIEVFRDLKNFRQEATLGSWIKTIVVRKALQRLRVEKRFEEFNDKHDQVIEWHDGLTGEYLDTAIRSLPDGYRAVFTLTEVEGFAHKEVAEMLGISEGTSKSQLYHAKKFLQKKLKDLYHHD